LALALALAVFSVAFALAVAVALAREVRVAGAFAGPLARASGRELALAFALCVAGARQLALLALHFGFAALHARVAVPGAVRIGIHRRRTMRRLHDERRFRVGAHLGPHFAHHFDGRLASALAVGKIARCAEVLRQA